MGAGVGDEAGGLGAHAPVCRGTPFGVRNRCPGRVVHGITLFVSDRREEEADVQAGRVRGEKTLSAAPKRPPYRWPVCLPQEMPVCVIVGVREPRGFFMLGRRCDREFAPGRGSAAFRRS